MSYTVGYGGKTPFSSLQFFLIVPEKIACISLSDGFSTHLCGFQYQKPLLLLLEFSVLGIVFQLPTVQVEAFVSSFLPIPLAEGSTSFVSVFL